MLRGRGDKMGMGYLSRFLVVKLNSILLCIIVERWNFLVLYEKWTLTEDFNSHIA